MPVSEAVRRLSEDPAFWAAYLAGERAEQLPPLRVTFPVAGGYGLTVEADPATGDRTIGLRTPATTEPVQLGWAAPGLPVPAALRWWELELCARVVALADPMLPHPGLVVALLSPFAPAQPDDDHRQIYSVRETAYRSLQRPHAEPDRPDPRREPPLPIFTDAAWWPAPRMLDDTAIAALLAADVPVTDVRAGPRFPQDSLDDLLRHADRRLTDLSADPAFDAVRPLARRIATGGDLAPVAELVRVLTEGGCDHPTVLDALSEPLVPAEACWMIETLAGAAPGSLLARHV